MSVPFVLLVLCVAVPRQAGAQKALQGQIDKAEIERLIGQFNLVDRKLRFVAIDKLSAMGKRVMPYMWQYLEDENNATQVRVSVLQVIEGFGDAGAEYLPRLKKFLSHKDVDLRGYVLRTIGRMKGKAKPLLADIKKLWKDEDARVRGLAFYVTTNLVDDLGQLLPDLGKALSDPSAQTRLHLLRTLESVYGPAALPILDLLLERLADKHGMVRSFASLCIAAIGEPALPALTRLLHGDDNHARASALDSLGRIRPTTQAQLAELVYAFRDPYLHSLAVQALVAMGEPAVDALSPLLDDKNQATVVLTLSTLGSIGRPASKMWQRIAAIMEGPDPTMRTHAARAMSRMGSGAAPAITVIRKAAKAGDPKAVRLSAILALGRLGGAALPALPDLLSLTLEGDVDISQGVEGAFLLLGEHGAPVVGDLIGMLDHESPQVRITAVRSLTALAQPAAPGVRLALIPASAAPRRRLVLEVIGGLGEVAAPLVTLVIGLLENDDASIRRDAALSLMRIGGAGVAAATVLTKLLADRDSGVRLAAVSALGSVARMREDTVSKIVPRTKDAHEGVRYAAIEALGWPGNSKAVPVLAGFLDSEDEFARLRAAEALRRIGLLARPALKPLKNRLDVEESEHVRRAISKAIRRLMQPR
ncbi:MAG: HEAT repeat domain-containing protein [Planctomycetota bacterium]|nr:HEAT repeat domain-containing protein [Planctomycetota bacterium]